MRGSKGAKDDWFDRAWRRFLESGGTQQRWGVIDREVSAELAGELRAQVPPALLEDYRTSKQRRSDAEARLLATRRRLEAHLAQEPQDPDAVEAWVGERIQLEATIPVYERMVASCQPRIDAAREAIQQWLITAFAPVRSNVEVQCDAVLQAAEWQKETAIAARKAILDMEYRLTGDVVD